MREDLAWIPNHATTLVRPRLRAHARRPRPSLSWGDPLCKTHIFFRSTLLQLIQWPWTGRERLLRQSPRPSKPTTTQVLREIDAHRQTLIIGTAWIVIGERKRRSRTRSWPGSSVQRNASTSARGKATVSTTGTRRPRATFQKGVWGT